MLEGQRDDGFFIHQFDAQSRHADERTDLYDQAFVLFALAHASEALHQPSLMDDAETLWRLIEKTWSRPSGGFQEGEVEKPGRRRQNPHMHLFEAAMACSAASPRADMRVRMRERADSLGDLFLTRFYDPENVVVREFFTEDWAPAPGGDGKIWEPGHSFEWVWLLQHWARTGGPDCRHIAQRLHAHVLQNGLSANRAVAIDECWIGGGVKSDAARLWPQTERLKAGLALYEVEPGAAMEAEAAAAFDGLWLYLSGDGFWADRMSPDGSLIAESGPASSLYHILVAFLELFRVAGPDR